MALCRRKEETSEAKGDDFSTQEYPLGVSRWSLASSVVLQPAKELSARKMKDQDFSVPGFFFINSSSEAFFQQMRLYPSSSSIMSGSLSLQSLKVLSVGLKAHLTERRGKKMFEHEELRPFTTQSTRLFPHSNQSESIDA